MLIDIHVHNEGDPKAMFEAARQRGLDGLVFTGGPDFADLEAVRAAADEAGIWGLCGCSVATNRGVLLCFFPEVEAVKEETWLVQEDDKLPAASAVIEAVEARGGAVVAAHPYYKQIDVPMGDHIFSLQGLHACEAASPLATGMQRDLAIEASESLSLPCVGGSSARSAEQVGLATTFFPDPVETEAELVEQIRARKVVAVMSLDELPADARPSQPSRPRGQGNRGRRRGGRRPRRDRDR